MRRRHRAGRASASRPRARARGSGVVGLAALNAELNGIDNIEFRPGSLFEPVVGERFDHIVSNPPFVITPRSGGVPEYEYRDGGLVGDALVEAVVRSAGDHLEPGGVAQLLANWEYCDAAPDGFDRLPTVMLLRQGGGFGRTIRGDAALMALVGACDGELTAGAIVAAIAELLEVDEAALAAELLPAVRALVVDGFLRPAV